LRQRVPALPAEASWRLLALVEMIKIDVGDAGSAARAARLRKALPQAQVRRD
jgi:hypothetical protein